MREVRRSLLRASRVDKPGHRQCHKIGNELLGLPAWPGEAICYSLGDLNTSRMQIRLLGGSMTLRRGWQVGRVDGRG